jgi:cytochrome c551/c552
MKKTIIGLAVAGLMAAGSAFATDMPDDLIKAGGFACASCHKIDAKVVGPAWRDVSKFYNGKMEKSAGGKTVKEATDGKGVEEFLIGKVSKGGKGNWGSMAMTPNDPSGAKKADIKKLVDFILGLEKK